MSEIDWSRLRSITAREIISALSATASRSATSPAATSATSHPDGRRVTVSFHRPGDTFRPKTLRSIIETQARWTEDDLRA